MCYDPQVFKTSNGLPVPCGKCDECKSRNVSAWSFRLMEEEKRSSSSYFITLTYAPEHAKHLVTRNGFLSLEPRDIRKFFKSYWKLQERAKRKVYYTKDGYPFNSLYHQRTIKYFAVGEYGGRFKRPHFHVLIFNAKPELIEKAWTYGSIYWGKVEAASVGYCLVYISAPSRIPMHRNDDRLPEFSRMSKGLGKDYLTPAMVQWHKSDLENRMYVNLKDGKKATMPRYFKDRLYSNEERKKISEKTLLRAMESHSARAARVSEASGRPYVGKKQAILAQEARYLHVKQLKRKL